MSEISINIVTSRRSVHEIGTGKFTAIFSKNATHDEEIFCIFGVKIF